MFLMNKVRSQNSVLSHGARNEIIEKILLLVSEKGGWDISVSDISSACGTTPASLYSYFSSKNDMIHAAVEEMEKRFGSIASLPIPDKIPEEMKIKMITFYIFDFVIKNRWASDFVDPFSKYESTVKLIERITQFMKKDGRPYKDLNFRVYRFMAGLHFKIRYRFMRKELPGESDIDDLSRYMSIPE
jgi:AcrR family transcriptional regulator